MFQCEWIRRAMSNYWFATKSKCDAQSVKITFKQSYCGELLGPSQNYHWQEKNTRARHLPIKSQMIFHNHARNHHFIIIEFRIFSIVLIPSGSRQDCCIATESQSDVCSTLRYLFLNGTAARVIRIEVKQKLNEYILMEYFYVRDSTSARWCWWCCWCY